MPVEPGDQVIELSIPRWDPGDEDYRSCFLYVAAPDIESAYEKLASLWHPANGSLDLDLGRVVGPPERWEDFIGTRLDNANLFAAEPNKRVEQVEEGLEAQRITKEALKLVHGFDGFLPPREGCIVARAMYGPRSVCRDSHSLAS